MNSTQSFQTEGTGKFRCERDVLLAAFTAASRAVAARPMIVSLAGIKLVLTGNQLQLTGSDLDRTIQTVIEVTGEGNGSCVVPSRLVADILKAAPAGAVQLTVTDDQCHIKAGRASFNVRTLNLEEYPAMTEPVAEPVTIAVGDFLTGLKQVVSVASHDENRPILTGVLMSAETAGLRLVATDSYRLAVRDLPGQHILPLDTQVLVPAQTFTELVKLLGSNGEVQIQLDPRSVAFTVNETRLTSRLIEGNFPPYRNLLPVSFPNRLTVNRVALLEAVNRVKMVAKDATPIRLNMTQNALVLSANTADVGQATDEIEATYTGTDLEIAFNPGFLAAGLTLATGETVTIDTTDQLKPGLLRSTDDPNSQYLLMPIRA